MASGYTRTDIYESLFTYQGEKLSYDYFPFWRDVINDPSLTTHVDQLYRTQVWKCSRQVGKSANLGFLAVGFALEYRNINIIITQPTDVQISRFSVQNIKPLEQQSVIVERLYKDTKTTQSQVKNKSYTTGSRIILANIYTSTLSVRGNPGGITFIDEYQNTPPGNAQIVLEGMRRSPVRISVICGTPLEEENDLQTKFNESTGDEWSIKCSHCGHWNIDLGKHNVGNKGLICAKCHRRIDTRRGVWVSARPSAPIRGIHINELCIPTDAPGATDWNKLKYELGGNERAVQNEILGNSFSDNVHPITRKDIVAVCDANRVYVRDPIDITRNMKTMAFAGLDWAMETSERKNTQNLKSYTMLSIGHYDPSRGKIVIDFVKRYYDRLYDDPENVINDIVKWVLAFNIKVIGMDYGVGHKENQRIASIIGYERCMEIEYVGDLTEGVVWHRLSNKFCVGRTRVYDDTHEDFKEKGMYALAKYDGETSEYEQDLTTLYRFVEPHSRKSRWGKTAPDDFWQNLVYIRLAYMYWAQKLYYEVTD